MELRSKKLDIELKDLDRINEADFDSSDSPDLQDLTGAEAGQFLPDSGYRRDVDNN